MIIDILFLTIFVGVFITFIYLVFEAIDSMIENIIAIRKAKNGYEQLFVNPFVEDPKAKEISDYCDSLMKDVINPEDHMIYMNKEDFKTLQNEYYRRIKYYNLQIEFSHPSPKIMTMYDIQVKVGEENLEHPILVTWYK